MPVKVGSGKIADLSKKVELLVQNQNDGFNPAQFIDIFYENMTQTKMLSNRVEIIEDKINSITGVVETGFFTKNKPIIFNLTPILVV